MGFQMAYTLDGNANNVVKDFPLDTVGNYGNGGMKKFDLVIQTAGLLRRAGAAAGTALGVVEGGEFVGLVAQGQPYAAAKGSFNAESIDTTKNPNGVGKVRLDKSTVYRVPVYQGGATQTATNAHLGNTYAINLAATTNDQVVDLNVTATPSVKIIDRSADGKTVFVTLI